jgi:hypothetical protein
MGYTSPSEELWQGHFERSFGFNRLS